MAKVLDGSLKKGDSLQNKKYVIDKVIGSGGFGITYLAHFVYLDTKVAIKEFFWSGHSIRNNNSNTISPQSISIEKYDDLKSKFMDEAKTLSKFRHPNIVKVFDIFEENDTSYFVMEYIDGETLHGLIKKKKKIPYFETINYIAQISEAVQEVHKQGLLHRDIKPENIIITPQNNAILIDFGTARQFAQDKTMSHTAMVTPGYAPIEQYSSSSKRGAYTDIYGLGATLYYALTGFPPIPSVERYETDLTEPKQLNPEITPFVNRTIIKALAFKADERYQTVEHFLYDLLMQQVIEEPTKSTTDNKTDKKQAVEETEINIIVPTVSTVPDSIETKNEIVIEATDEISLLNKNETLLPEKSFDQNEEARNIKESLQETKIDDDLASKIELEKNIQLTIPSDVEKTVDYSIDQKEKTETPLKQKLEKPFVPEKKQAEKTLKQDTNEKKPKNKEDNTHKTEKTVVKQILPKTTQETFKKIDNQQPKTEQRSRKPLFIVIGIVSAACIAVLLFFLGIFNTNNTQTAQNGDTISQSNVEKEQTETPIDPTTDTALRVTTEAAEASNDSTTGTNTANSNRDSGNQRTSPYSFDYPVVIVTGGSFLMGCDACNDDSSPAKSVTVNSFSIGIYEVTNKLWKEIMGSVPNNNGCENCPVTKVSWNDVQTFLQKLNQKTGERWRLPTEAEWEYAARGGSRTQNYKFSGANDANKVAWNSQNSGGTVHAVGGKSANELGIYDMSGNVYEWCADKSPTNSSHRIFRSGSWLSEPTECTNAKRNSFGATYKNTELGFRICK